MKKIFTILLAALLLYGCKKEEPLAKEALYPYQPIATPSSTAVATFHQNVSFYQMFVYRYDPSISKWTTRIASHFSSIPPSDPSAIGFTNSYVADSGVPLFDMVKLYAAETGTTNIKTVKINAEKVLQFFPDFENAKTGIVKIVPQDITLTRSNLSTFKIGISGSGTYNENTQLIDVEVTFNDAAIGGAIQTYKYKMSPVALVLN